MIGVWLDIIKYPPPHPFGSQAPSPSGTPSGSGKYPGTLCFTLYYTYYLRTTRR